VAKLGYYNIRKLKALLEAKKNHKLLQNSLLELGFYFSDSQSPDEQYEWEDGVSLDFDLIGEDEES
jgi:hypothetical protein